MYLVGVTVSWRYVPGRSYSELEGLEVVGLHAEPVEAGLVQQARAHQLVAPNSELGRLRYRDVIRCVTSRYVV